MNKEELLAELQSQVLAGQVTKEEVQQRIGLSDISHISHTPELGAVVVEKKSQFSITKLLYIIGVIIVLLGLSFFVVQIWDAIGAFGRVVVTLGLGVSLTGLGLSLYTKKPETHLGTVFSFLGGAILPFGVLVLLSEMDESRLIDVTEWTFTVWFIALFGVYVLLYLKRASSTYAFFSIIHGTIALYLLTFSLVENVLYYRSEQTLFEYLTITICISYLALAKEFHTIWNHRLIGLLHLFGTGGIFLVAFIKLLDSHLWEFLFLLLVLGGLWLSVYMNSRVVLVVSTVAILAYVSYITGVYFAESIGWPVALVLLGFVFIGLGYASLTINKRYLDNKVE